MLRRLLLRERLALGAGLAAAVVQQAAVLALPWCIQHGLDEGITPRDAGTTVLWAGITAGVAFVMFAAALVATWWSNIAAYRIAHRVRADLVTAVAVGTSQLGHGDLAMRATRDVELVTTWVQGMIRWARVVVTVVAVIPAVALLDLALLAVLAVAMPVLALVTAQFPGRYERANGRLSAAHGDRADAVEDLLSASAAVRGLGGEHVLVRRHHAVSTHVTRHTLGVARIAAWWVSAPPAVLRAAIAVGLAVGGLAAIDGRITVGGLVAFISWTTTLTVALSVLVDLLVNRGQARVAAHRIGEVLAVPDPAPAPDLPATGTLTATGVTAVRDGRTVLGPVDIALAPGEFVALTGPTGSGKSALIRLLCALDTPTTGTVHFGGIPVDAPSPRIGLVPQRPVVLSGTLADNLSLDGAADGADMLAACHAAGLADFVATLPESLDTAVGERGTTLSGGQAQRLALARGLLARPAVLLLDDVTSAVDTETERLILARLREHAPDTAILFVSHRPAVLEAADRIVRLGVGEFVGG